MRYVASLKEWQTPDDQLAVWETAENPAASWSQAFLSTMAEAIETIIARGQQ